MALRAVVSSKFPMIIVLGATGTGKTKLGIEIAQKFAGEIISADSMQVYKGLDVVTAKASAKEREAAPHHLIDILEPHQMFTAVDFRNRALKLIDGLIDQEKLPIVVGGTVYYIESIVFKILVESMDNEESLLWDVSRRKRDFVDTDESSHKRQATEDNTAKSEESSNSESKLNIEKDDEIIDNVTKVNEPHNSPKVEKDLTPELMRIKLKDVFDNDHKFTDIEINDSLKSIDPAMAARLHPNNRRKNLRSIEVWLKSGRLHSEVLAEQKTVEGHLRRPGSTIIFWLKCEQNVHEERLNKRVDDMLEQGLIGELLDFHAKHNQKRIQDGSPPDYTKGIFQTLGFKEFHSYLMLTPEERETEEGKKLLEESIERMKLGTRRYAKRQNKMVKSRFLEHPTREVPPIYVLDTTDMSNWDENVKNKAVHIIESFLKNAPCDYAPLVSNISEEKRTTNAHSYNFCEVCNRILLGDHIFAEHLKSNKHKIALKHKNKQEKKNKEAIQDEPRTTSS